MSYDKIRNNLRQALDEGKNLDIESASEIPGDADVRIAEGIEKMKPLIQLLKALNYEVAGVHGLKIKLVELGHIALVEAQTLVTSHSYSISTNHENSKYTVEEFSSFSGDGTFQEDNYEYESVEDVMAKVMSLVGEHIGAMEAQAENYKRQQFSKTPKPSL
ncbi:MAG: hypothetical protein O7F15_07550 [Gammaproteobacteria bacterium]|nr:hypothetical protein [Gammaproteobacteria bacterium]